MSSAQGSCEALARLVTSALTQPAADELEGVRQRVFDTLVAVSAGRRAPGGRVGHLLVQQLAGGAEPGLADQVRLLAAWARESEVDDIHIASCTTPGSVVVPAALTVARHLDASDLDVVAAVIAGYEVITRLGTALDAPDWLASGIWPTYLLAPIGAAATAARLCRLDESTTAHALAIAASCATGLMPRSAVDPESRWFSFGCAVADGVVATLAAGAGLAGDLTLLDRLLASRFETSIDPDALASPARRAAIGDVEVKMFPGARQAAGAVEAVLAALDGVGIDQVARIGIEVPRQYARMIDQPRAARRMPSISSVHYQVAVALARPEALLDVARDELCWDELTRSIADRTTVAEADDLSVLYPTVWPSRVRIDLVGGERRERTVLAPFPTSSQLAGRGWDGLIDKQARLGLRLPDEVERRCRAMARRPDSAVAQGILDDLALCPVVPPEKGSIDEDR